MALLDEQFTETLQAGAPDITYEGNEGKEQQIAQALWDKLPPQVRMQFGSFAQFFSSGAWKKVLEMLQQQMQGREGQEEVQDPILQQEGQAVQDQGLGSMMQGPSPMMQGARPMAHGGIAGLDGRKRFILGGLGDAVGDILGKGKDVLGDIWESDIGKAAIIYGLTAGAGHFATGAPGGWSNMKWLNPAAVKGAWLGAPGTTSGGSLSGVTSGILGAKGGLGLTKGAGSFMPTWLGAGVAGVGAPFAMDAMGKWDDDEKLEDLKLYAAKFGYDYSQMIRDLQSAATEEEYNAVLAKYNLGSQDAPPWKYQKRAEGGRIRAQEGGLMDLGGMEKDYRDDGGFVPIGGEEKADDVPARLSKNEFVFTADAVRAAGGGDIDQGAEVMENVMKNLEGGGKISEESQGQGARDMFATSERLSEVI